GDRRLRRETDHLDTAVDALTYLIDHRDDHVEARAERPMELTETLDHVFHGVRDDAHAAPENDQHDGDDEVDNDDHDHMNASLFSSRGVDCDSVICVAPVSPDGGDRRYGRGSRPHGSAPTR